MDHFLVVHPLLDSIGGAEKVCFQVIKSLLEHGQSVSLLTLSFNKEKFKKIIGENLPSKVNLYVLEGYQKVKPPFSIYKRYWKMIKVCKRHRNTINELDFDHLFDTQLCNPLVNLLLQGADKKFRYVHFPDIHHEYQHSGRKRKIYLFFLRHHLSKGLKGWNVLFCNSNYTKTAVKEVWSEFGISEPVIVYPPVEVDNFWCDKSLKERRKRIVYIGRFHPAKRHNIMRELASSFPEYEFVSIGAIQEGYEDWFDKFTRDLPSNFCCVPNLPYEELIEILQNSRIYVHLYEGEHFGIAPIEAVAAGCVTLPHNSGGTTEFIPKRFCWTTIRNLKNKIDNFMRLEDWNEERMNLWTKIRYLNPKRFRDELWNNVQRVISSEKK